MIVELGFAHRNPVEAAVVEATETGPCLRRGAHEPRGPIDSRQLARALAERKKLHYVDLDVFEADRSPSPCFQPEEARRYGGVPIAFVDERTLLVTCDNPANVVGLDDVRMTTGYDVRAAISAPEDIAGPITSSQAARTRSRRSRSRWRTKATWRSR